MTNNQNYEITDPAEMAVAVQPPLTRHPGIFIREVILPAHNLNVSRLAEKIGVNRPNLSEVLAGKRDVSRELAYRLGALLGDAVCDLAIAYQHRWDLQQEQARRDQLKAEIAPLAQQEAA